MKSISAKPSSARPSAIIAVALAALPAAAFAGGGGGTSVNIALSHESVSLFNADAYDGDEFYSSVEDGVSFTFGAGFYVPTEIIPSTYTYGRGSLGYTDLVNVAQNFGTTTDQASASTSLTTSVPEPASALLALAAIPLLRRRKRS